MSIFQSIFLGIVQGLTEFLPVSSSAHLVILPYLLGWEFPDKVIFVFDVLVQAATLIGVIAYFWKDLAAILRAFVIGIRHRNLLGDEQARLGLYLILATVPAGIVGLLLKDVIEAAFANPNITALSLFITAGLLIVAERVGKRSRSLNQLNSREALWIGLFQAAAVFPGISRSGVTITGGMTRDLTRPDAARFSFLLSIPIMLAASMVAGIDLVNLPDFVAYLPVFLPGFIASGVVGYLSIRWLLRYLTRYPLTIFSYYCIGLGALTLLVSWIRAVL